MKYFGLSFFAILFFVSCGNEPAGPLELYEIDEIEDELLSAMEKKKVKIYSDKALKFQMEYEDFAAMAAKDSTGRRDLAGFSIITEEEMALAKGDFKNTSIDVGALAVYVGFETGGTTQFLPVAIVEWEEARKALKGSYKRRFYEYLMGEFMSDRDAYQTAVERSRLEIINETLFTALKEGSIPAYENDNLANVKSPGELEGFLAHKEEQMVPDPENEGEMVLNFVEVPISAEDISHFLPAYDEDENVVAITMMITENIQGFPLKTPWVSLDFDDVKKLLDESRMEFLMKHIENVMSEEESTEVETDTIAS